MPLLKRKSSRRKPRFSKAQVGGVTTLTLVVTVLAYYSVKAWLAGHEGVVLPDLPVPACF